MAETKGEDLAWHRPSLSIFSFYSIFNRLSNLMKQFRKYKTPTSRRLSRIRKFSRDKHSWRQNIFSTSSLVSKDPRSNDSQSHLNESYSQTQSLSLPSVSKDPELNKTSLKPEISTLFQRNSSSDTQSLLSSSVSKDTWSNKAPKNRKIQRHQLYPSIDGSKSDEEASAEISQGRM